MKCQRLTEEIHALHQKVAVHFKEWTCEKFIQEWLFLFLCVQWSPFKVIHKLWLCFKCLILFHFHFLLGKAPKSFPLHMCSLCLWTGLPARRAGQEGPHTTFHLQFYHLEQHHVTEEDFLPKSPQTENKWDMGENRCPLPSQWPFFWVSPLDYSHPGGSGLITQRGSKLLHQGELWLTHTREYTHFSHTQD